MPRTKKKTEEPVKKKGRAKKIAMPDVLEGRFCIAREHLDGHIETWTENEVFQRLQPDLPLPKFFDNKESAEDYIETFRDVTPDFQETALTPVHVVAVKRFLAQSYSIRISDTEEGGQQVDVDYDVTIKGHGVSWKDAAERARLPYVEQFERASKAHDEFLEQRARDEIALEDAIKTARQSLKAIDSAIQQFSVK